ncbi:MAG: restriction endonuclease subunit S [Planctomycetes bacterium]|nr:restriction endonuclease subunit S [Planctomycetota bacterium]
MKTPWPMVALGQVLNRQKEEITIDELTAYPRLTIRLNGRGIVVRDRVQGSEIGTKKQFVARKGQLVLSKIDARNGAFGILSAEADQAIITGNFWAFDHDPARLELRFLDYLTKTSTFLEFCIKASEGTTNRRYLQENRFLREEIPLPPVEEQRRIVAKIEALADKIEEGKTLRQRAGEEAQALLRTEMRRIFSAAAGCQFVTIESVCAAIIDNLHSNPIYAETGVPCMRSSDVGWGTLNLTSARKTSEAEFRRRTARGEPRVDDVVFVREGGGTGKAAIVEDGQRLSLGQRVMMIRVDKSKILPRFFLYQLLSPLIYEDQIVPFSKGSASPHLNISALRKFAIRLPGLADQCRIIAHLDQLRGHLDRVKRLHEETFAELDAVLPAILDRAFRGEL